jgi:hypothetical protein
MKAKDLIKILEEIVETEGGDIRVLLPHGFLWRYLDKVVVENDYEMFDVKYVFLYQKEERFRSK